MEVGVLFVCMGNICRSPTAEGVFRKLLEERGFADRIRVDSAGTIDYHEGDPPDARAQETALRRGIDLSRQRARQFRSQDFKRFDYVVAMDRENLEVLDFHCPEEMRDRLHLFCHFAPHLGVENVPDPYFGGGQGFDLVFDLVQAASEGLLDDIVRKHFPESAA